MTDHKRPLFYERYTYTVRGTSRSYTKVAIVVWEGEPESRDARADFVWMVMDHVPECGDFSSPDVEVERDLYRASGALRLALRLADRLKRTHGSHATPSDMQAMLAYLGAQKCDRDAQGDVHVIPADVARPL